MAWTATDYAGRGCGRRYEKELETHFRDCMLFYLDGRIRFERYCYGEAACLVFSVWAHGFDADGNILWDREPEFESQKTAIPRVLTDIQEDGDNFVLEADLPGFKKEDVKLDLDNGYLTISAQRNEELDDKDNEGRYIRQERATGSCARSFYVGKELEPKDISAKFENGILTLHLPKAEAKKLEPKQTLIEIE